MAVRPQCEIIGEALHIASKGRETHPEPRAARLPIPLSGCEQDETASQFRVSDARVQRRQSFAAQHLQSITLTLDDAVVSARRGYVGQDGGVQYHVQPGEARVINHPLLLSRDPLPPSAHAARENYAWMKRVLRFFNCFSTIGVECRRILCDFARKYVLVQMYVCVCVCAFL